MEERQNKPGLLLNFCPSTFLSVKWAHYAWLGSCVKINEIAYENMMQVLIFMLPVFSLSREAGFHEGQEPAGSTL